MSGLWASMASWWPQWQAFAGFAWPWAWLALPLPLLARWGLPPRRADDVPALRVPWGDRLAKVADGAPALLADWRVWPWLVWVLLCAALARPQQLGDAVAPPQVGRQMMLALDLSGSMSEPDMQLGAGAVDRLTAAKAVLADFLDRRVGDRVGLLVFGQQAYVLAPLTLDRASVREQLRDSVVGLAGRETALGDAIALAVKRLRAQQQGQRVLIVLTDGVNTAGAVEPLKAAELAKAEHVRVYTIAFGSEGGAGMSLFGLQLPGTGGGEDEVDEKTLRRIAEETGGRFFRARDTRELAGIYAELDRLEPVRGSGPAVRPRIERYPWPLAAALLIGLVGLAWPGKRA